MIVYKYMDIKYAIDVLRNGIFAARLDSFNDPYEYEGIRYIDDYRVCCLTKSAKQMIMWAYYGNHQGCCIAFDVPDNVSVIKNVEYKKDYYQHRDMCGDELKNNLYIKAYEWKHENEVRIVYHKPSADERLWRQQGEFTYFRAQAVTVIFGLRTDFSSKECQDLLRFIRDNTNLRDVKQCMLSQESYRIKWDKQFDYSHEILDIEAVSESDKSEEIDEFKALCSSIYDCTVLYREAVKKGKNEDVNTATKKLQIEMQKLFYLGEKNIKKNKELTCKVSSIVEKYNVYVEVFRKFIECKSKGQELESQVIELEAKQSFNSLVDELTDNL